MMTGADNDWWRQRAGNRLTDIVVPCFLELKFHSVTDAESGESTKY